MCECSSSDSNFEDVVFVYGSLFVYSSLFGHISFSAVLKNDSGRCWCWSSDAVLLTKVIACTCFMHMTGRSSILAQQEPSQKYLIAPHKIWQCASICYVYLRWRRAISGTFASFFLLNHNRRMQTWVHMMVFTSRQNVMATALVQMIRLCLMNRERQTRGDGWMTSPHLLWWRWVADIINLWPFSSWAWQRWDTHTNTHTRSCPPSNIQPTFSNLEIPSGRCVCACVCVCYIILQDTHTHTYKATNCGIWGHLDKCWLFLLHL